MFEREYSEHELAEFTLRLREAGIRRPDYEHEKAHTFPASIPMWDAMSSEALFEGFQHRGQSFWIYVHVPFCAYQCRYCFYYKECNAVGSADYVTRYLSALDVEMSFVRKRLGIKGRLPAHSIYIGGGTPTNLGGVSVSGAAGAAQQDALDALFCVLERHVEPQVGRILTCESCPDSLIKKHLHTLLDHDVNRLSIGLQTSDDDRLREQLGRNHTFQSSLEALEVAEEFRHRNLRAGRGIQLLNVDLMYGFPGYRRRDGVLVPAQSVEDFEADVREVLERAPSLPDSMTLYYLRYVPGTPLCCDVAVDERVSWESLLRMRQFYARELHARGYEMYRPHVYRLKSEVARRYVGAPTLDHNNYGAQIGFGPSSYSHLGHCVGRSKWPLNEWLEAVTGLDPQLPLKEWLEKVAKGETAPQLGTFEGRRLTVADRQTRTVVKSLCCGVPLDRPGFQNEFHAPVETWFGEKLRVLAELKLTTHEGPDVRLSGDGLLVDEEIAYYLYPSNNLQLGALEISSRVSRVLREVRGILDDETWVDEKLAALEAPGFASSEEGAQLIVQIWDLFRTWVRRDDEDGGERDRRLRRLIEVEMERAAGGPLASGLVALALSDALLRVDAEPRGLSRGSFEWADRLVHMSLDALLPSLERDPSGYRLSYERPAVHFGSVSFHPTESSFDKDTFTNVGFEWIVEPPDDDPSRAATGDEDKAIVERTRDWLAAIVRQLQGVRQIPATEHDAPEDARFTPAPADLACRPLAQRLWKAFGADILHLDAARIKNLSPRYLFQNYVSQLLKAKQSTFLARMGSVAPIVFVQTAGLASQTDNPTVRITHLAGNDVANVFEFRGDLVGLVSEYMKRSLTCDSAQEDRCCMYEPDGVEDESFRHCQMFSGSRKYETFLVTFRQCLLEFATAFAGDHVEGSKYVRSLSYPHLVELLFPFVYFGQPVLFASQYTSARGGPATSLSVALDPFRRVSLPRRPFAAADDRDGDSRPAARRRRGAGGARFDESTPAERASALLHWTAAVSAGLHALATHYCEIVLGFRTVARASDDVPLLATTVSESQGALAAAPTSSGQTTAGEWDVFISYAQGVAHDRSVAEGVKRALEGAGIRSFLAHQDSTPAEEWFPSLLSALETAEIVVLLCSPESVKPTRWGVAWEVTTARLMKKPILPITTQMPIDRIPNSGHLRGMRQKQGSPSDQPAVYIAQIRTRLKRE